MKREVILTQAHRLLASRPTCLLTTRYKGEVNVMSIAWVMPISLGPPLVAMAIHPGTHTYGLLPRSEELVLNIPGRPLAEQVMRIGRVSGRDEDKMELVGLTPESGRRVEVPWIDECLAHLECVVVDRLMPGDHAVFIAEIIGAWVEEEAFEDHWLPAEGNDDLSLLIHLGGSRFALLGEQIEAFSDRERRASEGQRD